MTPKTDWQAGLPGPFEPTVRENVARAIFEPGLWLACAAWHAAFRFPRVTVSVLTPVAFYSLVDSVSGADCHKLDVYCRGVPRLGWWGWGDEATETTGETR